MSFWSIPKIEFLVQSRVVHEPMTLTIRRPPNHYNPEPIYKARRAATATPTTATNEPWIIDAPLPATTADVLAAGLEPAVVGFPPVETVELDPDPEEPEEPDEEEPEPEEAPPVADADPEPVAVPLDPDPDPDGLRVAVEDADELEELEVEVLTLEHERS